MGKVKDDIVLDDDGYLIFDDSILDKIIVTKLNWLIANTVATPIALLKASASLTVSMSIQRPNNTGSLITVFMTKPPMAKTNLTI